ncbi:Flavoredoxin [Candidatus Burkholderia pumila]|uniref:Flavoredoxin n=1 Tax=Candidatus Burkholderia pumila TaxID=1090375 RepID=A0ABR5HKU6_9BURK|nr:Flavoredoxin [Candidatus Burkholderia pumila]
MGASPEIMSAFGVSVASVPRAAALATVLMCSVGAGALYAQEPDKTIVRIAELVIDPTRLDAYKAAVKEGMEDAIRLEPGVLAIYLVAQKDKPNSLRFFEIYASEEAYQAHINSLHTSKVHGGDTVEDPITQIDRDSRRQPSRARER